MSSFHNLHEISTDYIESMISNVKEMKALVFDNETQVIFSLEFGKSLALKHEIFLFENIEKIQAEQKFNLAGIFFIRPTERNLVLLKRILGNFNFKEIHLFFSNQLKDDFLQKLAQFDVNMQVKNVQEVYLDYYVINSNVFHLNIENCISSLSMTNHDHWKDYEHRTYERIAQGLISVCMSNRIYPIIKYVRGSDVCQKLAQKLFDFTKENYDFIRKECGQYPNGMLFIYDRKEDPVTPLINQWTYQAQLHEILGIKNNVIELKGETGKLKKDEKYVISDVDSIDRFFSQYKNADYGTVANEIQREADRLKQENNMLSKDNSIEELRKIIEKLPEKKKESMAITKHYKMFYQISEYVTKHKLMEISKIEQEIAVNDSKKDQFQEISQVLMDSKVSPLDKTKLYLLFLLRYEDDSYCGKLRNLMIENHLIDWVSYGEALIKYAGKRHRTLDCFQDRDFLSKGKKFFMNAFGQGNENAFMQHVSFLNGVVDKLMKGGFKGNEVYTLNQEGSSVNDMKFNKLIVFSVGGITFEETRDLTLLGNQLGINILCGGTNVINSKEFLAEMSLIKEKLEMKDVRVDVKNL